MFGFFNRDGKGAKEAKVSKPEAAEQPAPSIGDIRYQIEHITTRRQFFRNPQLFMRAILNANGAYGLYAAVLNRVGVQCPYSEADFGLRTMQLGEGGLLVLLTLPEPERMPLCYRMYFVCDANGERAAMYTVEKSMEGGFICGWTNTEVHLNYQSLKDPRWNGPTAGIMMSTEATIILDLYHKQLPNAQGVDVKRD